MGSRITYFLTKEKKAEVHDYYTLKNLVKDHEDFSFETLKALIINSKKAITKKKFIFQDGNEIEISDEKFDLVKIEHDEKYKGEGDSLIIVCGDIMTKGLEDAYRLESILNTKFNKSYEKFIDEQINGAIVEIIGENISNALDRERKETKDPAKEDKTLKQEDTIKN